MEKLSFSEATLSSLTSKIETKLKPSTSNNTKPSGRVQKTTDSKKSLRKSSKRVGGIGSVKSAHKLVIAGQPLPTPKPRLSKQATNTPAERHDHNLDQTNGKKRSLDGEVRRKEPVGKAPYEKKSNGLREEVINLGGTEEDFQNLENGASDSEVEGSVRALDPKLSKELQQMVRDLGIAGAGAGDLTDSAGGNEPIIDQSRTVNPNEITLKPRQVKIQIEKDSGLNFEPRAEWHSARLPAIPSPNESSNPIAANLVERLHEHANDLLKTENEAYTTMHKSSSSAHQFYSVIMASGTLSDKISALTLSVQESPLHTMRALENLVSLAKKRSRAQAIEVLTALKDLFGPGSLLPSDRHLRLFATQPAFKFLTNKQLQDWNCKMPLPKPLKEIHLLFWAYEDWLKAVYFDTIKVIESWCNDEIVFARTKAVDIVFELLRDKPEQESNLLRLLVNKLGDSEKKIASRASYNILQLQIPHPAMKPTIVSAVEADALFRPGQNLHAKYYAIITLNQTILSSKEDTIVKKVLEIYFSLFLTLLAKLEPEKQDVKKITVNKKGDRQGGGGTAGKMAMKKSNSTFQKGMSVEDEMREKIMSAVLTGINRALPFADTNDEFFERHIDTLFRVTHSSNFNTSVQALMLIQQLCGSHQAASDRFYRTLYESLLDPRLLGSSKQILYLNLLYRALRSDLDVKRVKAFAKRLLQVVAMHQPSFACGIIYLLRELEGVFPNLPTFIDQPEENVDDEEEVYRDVPENGDDHAQQFLSAQNSRPGLLYDGRKRAPEYSNADKSCLWELDSFVCHYHPSVRLFASKLMSHEPMPPKPDLDTLSLRHFLDRFVYRNPKKDPNRLHGPSLMQPMASGDSSGLFFSARGISGKVPVNSDTFSMMHDRNVDVDEVFFHKYFNAKAQGKQFANKKKDKQPNSSREIDNQDGDDDNEADDEIWQALVDSRPELEGQDSDVDLDMDDFSDFSASDLEELDLKGTEPGKPSMEEMDGEDSVILNFEDEDEDGALLGSDDEIPVDLDKAFEKEAEAMSNEEQKNVKGTNKQRKENRKRLKSLPTFASIDDYAELLGKDEEDF